MGYYFKIFSVIHANFYLGEVYVCQKVMLNPPEEGTMGITFSYPEPIAVDKETEVRGVIVKRLNNFFAMQ